MVGIPVLARLPVLEKLPKEVVGKGYEGSKEFKGHSSSVEKGMLCHNARCDTESLEREISSSIKDRSLCLPG